MKTLLLTQGKKSTIVDDDVYEWAKGMLWRAHYDCGNWYAVRSIRQHNTRTIERLHRVIAGAVGDEKTDHIDGDGLNNLRSNLRICTTKENNRNRKPNRAGNSSGFKGVTFYKSNALYVARIKVDGRKLYLGCFKSAVKASTVYDEAAIKYFGHFARLNNAGATFGYTKTAGLPADE